MIKRLIINITNHCNEYCPFCCVEASSICNNFMTIEVFNKILSSYTEDIEVQITGGEPTLHPDFLSFVKHAITFSNVQKVIIDTNGTDMENIVDKLNELSKTRETLILLKISINYWLIQQHPDHLNRIKNILSNFSFNSNFKLILSFAHRIPESLDKEIFKWLVDDICEYDIFKIIHPISFQGRAKKYKLSNTCLEKMEIRSAIPVAYATDGTCFNEDLDRRNKYELEYNR